MKHVFGGALLMLFAQAGEADVGALQGSTYVWRILRFTLIQASLSTLLSAAFGVLVARADGAAEREQAVAAPRLAERVVEREDVRARLLRGLEPHLAVPHLRLDRALRAAADLDRVDLRDIAFTSDVSPASRHSPQSTTKGRQASEPPPGTRPSGPHTSRCPRASR